jgi:hypothetical protein
LHGLHIAFDTFFSRSLAGCIYPVCKDGCVSTEAQGETFFSRAITVELLTETIFDRSGDSPALKQAFRSRRPSGRQAWKPGAFVPGPVSSAVAAFWVDLPF